MAGRTALLVGGAGGTGTLIAAGLRERGFAVTILHRGVHEPAEIADFEHIHADPHFAETTAEALAGREFDLVVLTYGRVRALAPLFAQRCARLIAVGGIPLYRGYLDPNSCHPPGMPLMIGEEGPLADLAAMPPGSARSFAEKMIAAEQAILEVHAAGGYAATILRYPAVYGPLAITGGETALIRRVQDGRRAILLPYGGLGTITRCSTFSAAGYLLGLIDCAEAHGRVLNCADRDQYTLGQWSRLIVDELGADTELIGLPEHLNWAAAHLIPLGGTTSPHALCDASAIRALVDDSAFPTAREALAQTVAWRLAHAPAEPVHAWDDPLDYAVEDEVIARLAAFRASMEPLRRAPLAVHPYPHPRQPSLGVDERGR